MLAENMTVNQPTDGIPAAQAPDTGPRPARWRQALIPVGRIVVLLAVAGFMIYSVTSQWTDVRDTWVGLAWPSVILSTLFALAGLVANTMGWRAAVADVEHRVTVIDSLRISLVGQLGKYIPGTVWAYLLQMELSRKAGIPRARAFIASLVATGLAITGALALGLIALPTLLDAAQADAQNAGVVRLALYGMLALLPIALICSLPRVLTAIIQLLLRVLRRPPLDNRLTWRGVFSVIGWSQIAWVCFGIHLWLLANAQAAPGFRGLVLCVGAMAVAVSVGMFMVLAPSGLGLREAVLVAALLPFLADAGGYGAALGIALASRFLITVADLLAAGVSELLARRFGVAAAPDRH